VSVVDDYLRCAVVVRDQLASPELQRMWDAPSALREWTVGGLAGHVARSVFLLPGILAAQVSEDDALVSAVDYFVSALSEADLDVGSPKALAIRERGMESAGSDVEDLLARYDAVVADLEIVLRGLPEDHVVAALGMRLALREYLITRLVEMTVHADDLAVSVSASPPRFPLEVEETVVRTLACIALRRRGFTALARGLARSERSPGPISAF